jgi:pentatricopeptide repeat protein
MSELDNTTDMGLDFVNALQTGNFTAAEQLFNDMLSDKVQSTLDAEKIAVAGQIFNGETPYEDDEDDVSDSEETARAAWADDEEEDFD